MALKSAMAKMTAGHRMVSSSVYSDDPSCVADACSNLPDLDPYSSRNGLPWESGVETEAVWQDFYLCLSPTDAVGFSLSDLLQLCDDASLMDSFEALPCTPVRHRGTVVKRMGDGNLDGFD